MIRAIAMSAMCGSLVAASLASAPLAMGQTGSPALAGASVPLPQPRPPASSARPDAGKVQTAPPSACRVALTEDVAIAPSVAPIADPGGCGGEDIVVLQAVVLPGGGRVKVEPPATLRCTLASALAAWVRDDLAPVGAKEGIRIVRIENYDSYSCRGRNRVIGAQLSEHGKANAIDIRAFGLADGSALRPTDTAVSRAFREAMRATACRRFNTVLGPGSDGYHESHVHVDLAARRGGFRLCQWDIRDAPTQEARMQAKALPPMPRPRPKEAPAR